VAHHAPEVVDGVGHGPLGGDVGFGVALEAGYVVGVDVGGERVVVDDRQVHAGRLV